MSAAIVSPSASPVTSPDALLVQLKTFIRCAQEDAARIARQTTAQFDPSAVVATLTYDLTQAQVLVEQIEQMQLDVWAEANAPIDDTGAWDYNDDELMAEGCHPDYHNFTSSEPALHYQYDNSPLDW